MEEDGSWAARIGERKVSLCTWIWDLLPNPSASWQGEAGEVTWLTEGWVRSLLVADHKGALALHGGWALGALCGGASVEGLGEGNGQAPSLELVTVRTVGGVGNQAQSTTMTTPEVYRTWGTDCTLGAWSLESRQETCPLRGPRPEKYKGKPLLSDAGQPWGD